MTISDWDYRLYKKNVFSQFGEDGIIVSALEEIKKKYEINNWSCELGAWDGIYLSNTANLIRNLEFKAVLIEANKKKFQELEINYPNSDVFKFNLLAQSHGENLFESILARTPIPMDFDVLSIDIDGNDYYIFESLKLYRPKLIIIEFNPTIPNHIDFVQENDLSLNQGASPLAIDNLAKIRNYRLIASTECNLIFLNSDLEINTIPSVSLNQTRNDLECNINVFVGYDGKILFSKQSIQLPWHSMEVQLSSMQVLPVIFRSFPNNWTKTKLFMYKIYRIISILVRQVVNK